MMEAFLRESNPTVIFYINHKLTSEPLHKCSSVRITDHELTMGLLISPDFVLKKA